MGKTATDECEIFFPSIGKILLTAINKSIHPTSSEDVYGIGGNDCDNRIQKPLLTVAQGILGCVESQQIMKSHAKASIIFQQGRKRMRQLCCSRDN